MVFTGVVLRQDPLSIEGDWNPEGRIEKKMSEKIGKQTFLVSIDATTWLKSITRPVKVFTSHKPNLSVQVVDDRTSRLFGSNSFTWDSVYGKWTMRFGLWEVNKFHLRFGLWEVSLLSDGLRFVEPTPPRSPNAFCPPINPRSRSFYAFFWTKTSLDRGCAVQKTLLVGAVGPAPGTVLWPYQRPSIKRYRAISKTPKVW